MAGFNAIKSEVIARLGNRTDITSRVSVWINDAFFELLLNPTFEFFELDTVDGFLTVAGSASYSLPDALWYILDVTDTTNSRKLTRTHWQVLDRVTPTSGQPDRYARFGQSIQLDPIPDAIYQITFRFRGRPAELTSFSAETGIGREWDEVITLLAVMKGWEALDDLDRASMARGLAREAIARRMDVPQLEDMDSTTTLAPVLLFKQ